MAKKKPRDTPAIAVFDIGPEPALKKQSRYDNRPWQPGETPTRNGSLIPINQPLDAPRTPYGEHYGVEKPANRGQRPAPVIGRGKS